MRVAPSQDPPASPRAALRIPFFVPLGALLLYFLRFGYDYATSDQDELLPALLHRLDPRLFATDWFVQTQASAFDVREYVVGLLQGLAWLFPVWLSVLLLYVTSWLLIAGAVYAIAHRLTRQPVSAALSVVLCLVVLTPQWTLGGNDLVSRLFAPSMAGWALGLWAVYAYLCDRPLVSAVLLGLTTWLQALVGLQLAGLLSLLLLLPQTNPLSWSERIHLVLRFGSLYVLCAAPLLGPVLYDQFTSPPVESSPSLFYIMVRFRNPHHYLFFSFPPTSYIRFGLLCTLGLAGLFYLHKQRRLWHSRFVMQALGAVLVIGGLAFILTELVPVLFVAKLQLFKYTVLAKVLLVIGLAGAGIEVLPERWRTSLQHLYRQHRWWNGLLLALWVGLLVAIPAGLPFLTARAHPLAHTGTPIDRIETWARTQTDPAAVFGVPPSWSGFRSRAQRPIVIDFKAFPYQERHMPVWFDRLMAVAPIPPPDRGGGPILDDLDAAYQTLPAAAWHTLGPQYNAAYVVREGRWLSAPFPVAFAAGPWVVYALPPVQ